MVTPSFHLKWKVSDTSCRIPHHQHSHLSWMQGSNPSRLQWRDLTVSDLLIKAVVLLGPRREPDCFRLAQSVCKSKLFVILICKSMEFAVLAKKN